MRGELLLSLILIISLTSAAPSLEFQNGAIQPGETILGKLSTVGEFTEKISKDRVKFYEGRKSVFIEYDLAEYDGDYYFYAYANREGNFTLKIKNILFKEADTFNSIDLEKNFEVKSEPIQYTEKENLSGNITDVEKTKTEILQIKPGFSKFVENPQIKLINKGSSQLNFTLEGEEVSLDSQEVIEVPINQSNESVYFLNVSTYKDFSVPIFFQEKISPTKENKTNPTIEKTKDLRSRTKEISLNLVATNKSEMVLELFNFGYDNLTEMNFSTDLDFIQLDKIEYLQPKAAKNITLVFNSDVDGIFNGSITIEYSQNESQNILSIPVTAKIIPNGTKITNESFVSVSLTCDELGGTVCTLGESCDGDFKWSNNPETGKDDYCCLASCVKSASSSEEGSGGSGKIIGVIIILVLGAGGYFLYKKQKNVKPASPESKMKKISENHSKRMSGSLQRS